MNRSLVQALSRLLHHADIRDSFGAVLLDSTPALSQLFHIIQHQHTVNTHMPVTQQRQPHWPAHQQVRSFRATIERSLEKKEKTKFHAQKESSKDQQATPAPTDQAAPALTAQITVLNEPDVASTKQQRTHLLRISETSPQLTAKHIGNYYPLQPSLIPEAFPALHRNFLAPRTQTEVQKRGSCVGLQQEMHAVSIYESGSAPLLMHREIAHAVWQAIATGSLSHPRRLLLRGPTGSGKSCLMVATVERARASGWLCLYIPSATALVRGGYFVQRNDTRNGNSSTTSSIQQWDTPIAAQHILLGMQQAHGTQLNQLPCRLEESKQLLQPIQQQQPTNLQAQGSNNTEAQSRSNLAKEAQSQSQSGNEQPKLSKQAPRQAGPSLGQLVTHGLAADDAHAAVDVVLLLVKELASLASETQPVLVAIDDYNALYGGTGYAHHVRQEQDFGEPAVTRVPLKVHQLRLANSLRFLEAPDVSLGRMQVITSVSHTIGISNRIRVPLGARSSEDTEVFVPRFSQVELAHALQHYHECGIAPSAPTLHAVDRLLLLTNGNAAEIRKLAANVSLLSVRGSSPPQLLS